MRKKVRNSPIDQLWDGEQFHQDLEQFTQYHLDMISELNLDNEALPTEMWECMPEYFAIALDTVIEAAFDGFEFDTPVEAQSIAKFESEILYDLVDDDDCIPELEGVEEFQKAIDRFCWLNRPIWYMFQSAFWFNPNRIAIGKMGLKKAIDRVNQANHGQWVYGYDDEMRVELTPEFWEEWQT